MAVTASDCSASQTIALFPLKSVLFPKGRLPLQIFEQRYIDLISECMRSEKGFGVCLLKEGDEVVSPGSHQQVHRVGTYATIVDWDQLPNGLLGVTVEGERKFMVQECHYDDKQVLRAKVKFSDSDCVGKEPIELEHHHEVLVDLVEQLVSHPVINKLGMNIAYHDLRELGWRLSELVPLELEQKQALLELQDPRQRIERIEVLLHRMIDEGGG